MKIEELKKALRIMIREEVKKSIPEEVNKVMGKLLVEMIKEIKSSENSQKLVENKDESNEQLIHTKNSKLNDVLNETARYGKNFPKPDSSKLVELMDGGFDKIGNEEEVVSSIPSSNMDFLKQMVGNSGTPNVPIIPPTPSVLDYQNELPDSLQGVFKKDFRSTMKKLDEIKKNGGSGLINPGQIFGE